VSVAGNILIRPSNVTERSNGNCDARYSQ